MAIFCTSKETISFAIAILIIIIIIIRNFQHFFSQSTYTTVSQCVYSGLFLDLREFFVMLRTEVK